jgi:hypothetical protein
MAFDEHASMPEPVCHLFAGEPAWQAECSVWRENNWRQNEVRDIVSALSMTSRCGWETGLGEFGQTIPRHYPKEVESCLA